MGVYPAPSSSGGGGGAVVLADDVAAAGGVSQFVTGVLDLTPYRTLELRLRGRSDNADIYDIALVQFNTDTTIGNYGHAAQGSNPISTLVPGGFFAARWDSRSYFGSSDVGAVTVAGILAGYVTGATAEAGLTAALRGIITDPGDTWVPHSGEFYTRFIESEARAHAAADNGPEIITTAGFWFPAVPQAIDRIRVIPGIGTEFNEGTTFQLLGHT